MKRSRLSLTALGMLALAAVFPMHSGHAVTPAEITVDTELTQEILDSPELYLTWRLVHLRHGKLAPSMMVTIADDLYAMGVRANSVASEARRRKLTARADYLETLARWYDTQAGLIVAIAKDRNTLHAHRFEPRDEREALAAKLQPRIAHQREELMHLMDNRPVYIGR